MRARRVRSTDTRAAGRAESDKLAGLSGFAGYVKMAVTRSAFDLKGCQSRHSTSCSQRRIPDEVAVQQLLSTEFTVK